MRDYNLAAIHDRIDEEHFEIRMQLQAIQALQRTVAQLESAVRALEVAVLTLQTSADEELERTLDRELRPAPKRVKP